jgi:hypothetical protein
MELETSNPVLDQIFSHRSVRRFDPHFEIPRKDIEIIPFVKRSSHFVEARSSWQMQATFVSSVLT